MACTVTVPGDTAVTSPVVETVASLVLEDCQVACAVTSCVEPFDIVAVAVNCDDAPTTGAAPDTLIDDTVEGAVVELPHASMDITSPDVSAIAPID